MTKNRDFDFGMDNAELEEGIRQASEFEQSKQLAEDIRQSLKTLKSIDLSLQLLGSSLVELHHDAQYLNADLDDKVRQLRNALTIVIPPETTEHVNDVFTTLCKTFDKNLQDKLDAAIKKAEQDLNDAEKRMKEQTDRIAKDGDNVVVPSSVFYASLTLLLCLAVFFGITWWINANIILSLELQKLCHTLTAVCAAINACIFMVWHTTRMSRKK